MVFIVVLVASVTASVIFALSWPPTLLWLHANPEISDSFATSWFGAGIAVFAMAFVLVVLMNRRSRIAKSPSPAASHANRNA